MNQGEEEKLKTKPLYHNITFKSPKNIPIRPHMFPHTHPLKRKKRLTKLK